MICPLERHSDLVNSNEDVKLHHFMLEVLHYYITFIWSSASIIMFILGYIYTNIFFLFFSFLFTIFSVCVVLRYSWCVL